LTAALDQLGLPATGASLASLARLARRVLKVARGRLDPWAIPGVRVSLETVVQLADKETQARLATLVQRAYRVLLVRRESARLARPA